MTFIISLKKTGSVALWFIIFFATLVIGTVGADPRIAHLWWLLAMLILIGGLAMHSGRQWGLKLLKIAFFAGLLLSVGETGYDIGSLMESSRLHTFIGIPVALLSWLFIFYFFTFPKYGWFFEAKPPTGETAPKPKIKQILSVVALLLVVAFLGLTAGYFSWHLGGHINIVSSLAFSPDGKVLASGSRDTTVKLWDTKSGKLLKTLTGHKSEIPALAFSHDGRLLASGGWAAPEHDDSVKVWEVSTGRLLHTFLAPTCGVFSLAFSPDDKLLAIGTQNGVKLWDIAAGRLLKTMETDDAMGFVGFAPDGKTLISGTLATISFWSLPDGVPQKSIKGYCPIAGNPDGEILAISDGNSQDLLESLSGPPAVFTLSQDKALRTFRGPASYINDNTLSRPLAAPNPDWHTLAVAEPWPSTTLALWNLDTGKKMRSFSRFILMGGTWRFERVAFSPDGKYLAVGSNERTPLVVWEVATGKRRPFNGGWLNLIHNYRRGK